MYSKGHIVSEETRKKLSDSLKGRVSPNKGKRFSEEIKRNMSLAAKYHKKLGQKQKDLLRQQKIIDILKPRKFWRYDAINKTFENVLESK